MVSMKMIAIVIIVTFTCVNKATAVVNLQTDVNKKIVQFGGQVLAESAEFAMSKWSNKGDVLKKLVENALKHEEANIPADLFEVVLHDTEGIGRYDEDRWKRKWDSWRKNPASARTYIGESLERVPLQMLAPNGLSVEEELQKAMPGWQPTKPIDSTKFDPLFKPSRFTLKSKLGDGEFGSVFLMTDKAAKNNDPKEVALKIIPWEDKSKLPKEVTLHENLSKVAALKSFIPAFIDKGQCANAPFAFVAMGRIGPILLDYTNVRDKGVNNAWASKEETMEIVARMYHILQEFHKAGYYHGDNLVRNWALNIDDKNGLLLYDFGTSKQLKGDFGWVAADLWRWTEVSKQVMTDSGGPMSPIAKAGEILSGGSKLMTALQAELRKVLWNNEVHPLRHIVSPLLQYVKFDSYEAFMGKSLAEDPGPDFKTGAPELKQFRKLWADWLKLTGYPANVGKPVIHHWVKPAGF